MKKLPVNFKEESTLKENLLKFLIYKLKIHKIILRKTPFHHVVDLINRKNN